MKTQTCSFGTIILIAWVVAGLPEVLRAYSPGAHQFITWKASEVYGKARPGSEPLTNMQWISFGSAHEDETDHVFGYTGNFVTMTHFWDADKGPLDQVTFWGGGLGPVPNAFQKVTGYGCARPEVALWQQALHFYLLGDKATAYERLGHISHLIQDMSVPAHAHEDYHGPDFEDYYEETVSGSIVSILAMLDKSQLDQGLLVIPPPPPGVDVTIRDPDVWPLYYLMYTVNQHADAFGSSFTASSPDCSREGDIGDWVDMHGFVPYFTWPGQLAWYQDPCHIQTPLWRCTCGSLLCIGGDVCLVPCPNGCSGLNRTQVNPQLIIATTITLPYAVRATATLWDLFERTVNPPVTNMTRNLTYLAIQAAIDQARDGDEIAVRAGTYYESLRFFGQQVHLRSTGGPAVTTINGNGSAHVIQCRDGEGPGTILEGFTITGGRALGLYADSVGGGMLTVNSSPVITNCIFLKNTAAAGGGLAAYGTNAPLLVNCQFADNIAANNGGGMLTWSNSPAIHNCIFRRNAAVTGGGLATIGSNAPSLVNSLFCENIAINAGGGVYSEGGNPLFNQCTISSNQAVAFGGGVVQGTLTNCIVYDNTAPLYPNCSNSFLEYSCTWPLPASGTGNITDPPQFCDAASGDFRLGAGSPCIDIGKDWNPVLTNDLAGHPRLQDGDGDGVAAFDLGAYELQPLASTVVVNTSYNLVGDTSGLSAQASASDLVNCTGGSCVGSLELGPRYSRVPLWTLPDVFGINNGNAISTYAPDGAYLPKTFGGGRLPCAVGFVLNTNAATGGAPNGYQLTSINSFAGFFTNSRTLANQRFKVEYRPVGWSAFNLLGTFTNAPFGTGDDGPSSTLVSLSATGMVLAAHVQEVVITYLDHGVPPGGIAPTNDGTVLKEVDILGFPGMVLSKPSERQVIQRDANSRANIRIEGGVGHAFTRVEARAVVMPGTGNTGQSTDWTSIVTAPGSNAFAGTLVGVAAGGWYQIEVRVYDGDLLLDEATVERVGVGDIFITAGQSNAGCFGELPPEPTLPDDRVSAYNLLSGTWKSADDPQPEIHFPPGMGLGGSPWPGLGTMLATKNQVPVGFVGLAHGATAIRQWLAECPDLALYWSLTNTLLHFGPNGVRCVLWHQGESDALYCTNNYAQTLNYIIAQSRLDAGWSVPWGIAEASYYLPLPPLPPATLACQEAVAAGQRAVIYGNTNVFRGPRTDDFVWEGKLAIDHVHFNQAGLEDHARQWFEAIEGLNQDPNPINGNFEYCLFIPLLDGEFAPCSQASANRPPRGWNVLDASGTTSAYGVCGFYNPDSSAYSQSGDTSPSGGVLANMDGPQVAYLVSPVAGDSFLQTLRAKLRPSTVYTLTAAIGVRDIGTTPFGGYQVEWLTNGQPCATTSGDTNTLNVLAGGNAAGRFTMVSCTYTSAPSVTPNQQLAIRITKMNPGYLDFDNVQVTNTPTLYGQFQFANWFDMSSPDSLPEADPDHDGYSNWDEFIAGTCPVSASSVPRILQIVRAGSEVQVQVRTCAGSIYQLECCHGLPAAPQDWTAIGAAITGDGEMMTLVDPAPSLASQRFYRVRISR